MKDLDKQQDKDRLEIVTKKNQEQSYKLDGKLIPHANHTLWEINNKTGEIDKATFTQVTAVLFGQTTFNKEVVKKANHSYVSALKKVTALKKWKVGDNGSKKFLNIGMTL